MKDLLKDVIKGGVTMFAVGALLALSAPHIANALHIDAAVAGSHDVLWTGAFFGAFGAIHEAVAPILDFAFGSKSSADSSAPAQEKEPAVTLYLNQEPEQAHCNHCAKLQTERAMPQGLQLVK